jgi:hypothetical protein
MGNRKSNRKSNRKDYSALLIANLNEFSLFIVIGDRHNCDRQVFPVMLQKKKGVYGNYTLYR